MYGDSAKLLEPEGLSEAGARALLEDVGFSDWQAARRRLLELARDERCRQALGECLPTLLYALSDAATPDGSLVNFERYAQSVDDRGELFEYLAGNPRAIEILVRLFVGSQFLTEILLRNPEYLRELTQHKRLAEFKYRQQFCDEQLQAAAEHESVAEKLNAVRRYQKWELLRIGACDSFGLMDLKTVTVQLSLLADSIIRSCLEILADDLGIAPEGFAVLAFGKLGGEELNYSSDVDLVFLSQTDATRFWPLGQRLIKALMDSTAHGFLYRVDMRLRPWGRSGALVNTVDAHLTYLQKHGRQWEKQALLKARCVAGDESVGADFLQRVRPLMFSAPVDVVRQNVRETKEKIEAGLEKQGRGWGEVKSGSGSIRDVEFVTQFLQLAHGGENPVVQSINTLDGLVRLADLGYLQADEYRKLASGYVFLRTVEHALQLMHHKQVHALPEDERELAYLARRLDYPGPSQFLQHYQRHSDAIRRVYEKYIEREENGDEHSFPERVDGIPEHAARMEPSYKETFSEEEIQQHAKLLSRLSEERIARIEARALDDDRWEVTIVGYDYPGDLSVMCGLLFVYGFNIVDGDAFSAGLVDVSRRDSGPRPFVNVFRVEPPLEVVLPEVWQRYEDDLCELAAMHREGRHDEAQGRLAKRIGGALREVPEESSVLYPVEVQFDNESSENSTVLHIRGVDTRGFLYELTNSLVLTSVDVKRLVIGTVGNTVVDTLWVTDADGRKIVDVERQQELQAAIVLIKHFTHLLPRSPNPEAALLHFREFLQQLFQQPERLRDLASLERSDVLDALARLLGVSNFLWEDFLRLQHDNLFPVVRDVESLSERKSKAALERELEDELSGATDMDQRRNVLNAFKDREMFRADMRHILGLTEEFGQFSAELTDLAEVVVAAATETCAGELRDRYGEPRLSEDGPSRLAVCALGKCGGRELGYASDVELMFVYEGNGSTTGPEVITAAEFYQKLVESFTQTIRARQEGIFQIDLRLRPYGRAGSLAVALDAFRQYFGPQGAAWPYERQALVKLRPIAGDAEFGETVRTVRDELIYSGEGFDVAAMHAMREKQVRQLVRAGTFNAKLSPGGLVDVEYVVQGLQITHGHAEPSLRATNTRQAIDALCAAGVLTEEDRRELQESYVFLRRLIDALRMVRGHAKELTVPEPDTEAFEFLARRLNYGNEVGRLREDLQRHTEAVQRVTRRFGERPGEAPLQTEPAPETG